jgi:hypothetical protein
MMNIKCTEYSRHGDLALRIFQPYTTLIDSILSQPFCHFEHVLPIQQQELYEGLGLLLFIQPFKG